jgi:hypothetical protein
MPANHIVGLEQLLARWAEPWDDEAPGPQAGVGVRIYTRSDPRFLAAIEPGVRELVLVVIRALGYVTYSSCEGHRQLFAARHVGILPRSDDERREALRVLDTAAQATNATRPHGAVRVLVRRRVVTSEGPPRACVDVVFAARTDDEDAYFDDLEPAYREYLDRLLSG